MSSTNQDYSTNGDHSSSDEDLSPGPSNKPSEPRVKDGFDYHVVHLTDAPDEVHSLELREEVAAAVRLEAIQAAVAGSEDDIWAQGPGPEPLAWTSRTLTTQRPFQELPRSAINAWGDSWSFITDTNEMQWVNFRLDPGRKGTIEFVFDDVPPDSTVLITVEMEVGWAAGVTGTYKVHADVAWNYATIPVTGPRDSMIDIIVRSNEGEGRTVTIELAMGRGLDFFSFQRASYRMLTN